MLTYSILCGPLPMRPERRCRGEVAAFAAAKVGKTAWVAMGAT